MQEIYPSNKTLSPVLKTILVVMCTAAYGLCCLPSFRLIGHFVLQMVLSLILSLALTVLVFLFVPRGLQVLSNALSLFLMTMLIMAIYQQVQAQMVAESFNGWIYTFFYDKPLTVAVVWGTAYCSVLLFRLFSPFNDKFEVFRSDFKVFYSRSTAFFIVFYCAVLVYCFLLLRRPGGQSGLNLIPFAMIQNYIKTWSVSYESLFYLIGNILCLFPFGFFWRVRNQKRNLIFVILIPILISGGIELTQLLLRMGDFDIDDIIMNASGFYFGYFLSFLFDTIRSAITKEKENTIFG